MENLQLAMSKTPGSFYGRPSIRIVTRDKNITPSRSHFVDADTMRLSRRSASGALPGSTPLGIDIALNTLCLCFHLKIQNFWFGCVIFIAI